MSDPFDPALLPAVIARFLEAHRPDPRDVDASLAAFAPGARVTDEGLTHTGTAAIRGWLEDVATEYTYTIDHVGQARIDDHRWDVLAHLEGDFPGGVADLRFAFRLDGDRIAELVID